jgi:hypothetical protein
MEPIKSKQRVKSQNHDAIRAVAKYLITEQDADAIIVRDNGVEVLEVDGKITQVFDGYLPDVMCGDAVYLYDGNADQIILFNLVVDRWIIEDVFTDL